MLNIQSRPKLNKKAFVIGILRRGSYRWAPRYTALKEARIARNQYVCKICNGTYPRKLIVVDHVNPVVNPQRGFTDWNDYVERMYADYEGFQAICEPCHAIKTRSEGVVRTKFRQKRKKENGILGKIK